MPDKDRPSIGNAIVALDETGEIINEASFRRMLRYMSEGGTNLFVGGGHATEFASMNRDEQQHLWEIAVDELHGRGPVNAIPFGPGSTTEMIRLFSLARDIGFDGAGLYPGGAGARGSGSDGLFAAEAERYYRDVLEAVDLPMYLQGYAGSEIIDSPNHLVPFDLLLRLLDDYPHIIGVTVMGSGDENALREFISAVGGRRPVRLAGALDWGAMMDLGVYGFHSIQQSIAPRLCSTMIDAYQSGDKDKARELSDVLRRLNQIIHTPSYHYPRSIKPILNHLGFDVGTIRRPYLPPTPDTQAEMRRRVDELDLARYEDLPG